MHVSLYSESAVRNNLYRATLTTDCDTTVNGNEGCGLYINKSGPSYGMLFNMNGGGYYVMVRLRVLGIQIYFWPRDNSTHILAEIHEYGSGGYTAGMLELLDVARVLGVEIE